MTILTFKQDSLIPRMVRRINRNGRKMLKCKECFGERETRILKDKDKFNRYGQKKIAREQEDDVQKGHTGPTCCQVLRPSKWQAQRRRQEGHNYMLLEE